MDLTLMRACVPKLNLDNVLELKKEIAKSVEEELDIAMTAYGNEILQTIIIDIEPDQQVKCAMNEINACEAESKYLYGLDIARQRQAIVDGLRDSVLGFTGNVPGTSGKDVLDMVMMTQYFDTMRDIGAHSKSSSVFIPHGPGAVSDVATQIRNRLLQVHQTNA
ncbi:unnamed protein product [Eruca vesicaria subsp. sativa]|uniref:Band 7 domain-containing protein n=1 Tax=Eruca vesicaria subsp. sativa TaxID=29727 RepID=A0ABC8JVC6_ERUVS|nr:unnamed protein product [Eruca vesicaria subsp. sativa]